MTSSTLFINTDATRRSAQHLRTMATTGDEIADDVAIAAALAELPDPTNGVVRLVELIEALRRLAQTLQHRCDEAEWGLPTPREFGDWALGQLRDYFDNQPSGPIPIPLTPERLEQLRDHADEVIDVVADWLGDGAPVPRLPIVPLLDGAEGWWDRAVDAGGDALGALGSSDEGRRDAIALIPDTGFGVLDRFVDRVSAAASEPGFSLLGPVTLAAVTLETLTYYGPIGPSLTTPRGTVGALRSNAGGIENHGIVTSDEKGWGISLGFTQMDVAPSSGPFLEGHLCGTYACAGSVLDGDGLHPTVEFGAVTSGGGSGWAVWGEGKPSIVP